MDTRNNPDLDGPLATRKDGEHRVATLQQYDELI